MQLSANFMHLTSSMYFYFLENDFLNSNYAEITFTFIFNDFIIGL